MGRAAGLPWSVAPAIRPVNYPSHAFAHFRESEMSQIEARALQDDELQQLDQLLETYGDADERMDLEMLDGFACAIALAPQPLDLTSQADEVMGRAPAWQEGDEAVFTGLLARFEVRIAQRLAETGDPDDPASLERQMPLIAFPEDIDLDDLDEDDDPMAALPADFPAGLGWGIGFMAGVGLDEDGWDRWAEADERVAELLDQAMELTLCEPEQLQEIGDPEGELPSLDDRMSILAGLPGLLAAVRAARPAGSTRRH
ncbi:MAG: YecA family protein [Xanthomonadales bacterium]|nr:YecA family protein [Xanthomonadales bacterium]